MGGPNARVRTLIVEEIARQASSYLGELGTEDISKYAQEATFLEVYRLYMATSAQYFWVSPEDACDTSWCGPDGQSTDCCPASAVSKAICTDTDVSIVNCVVGPSYSTNGCTCD